MNSSDLDKLEALNAAYDKAMRAVGYTLEENSRITCERIDSHAAFNRAISEHIIDLLRLARLGLQLEMDRAERIRQGDAEISRLAQEAQREWERKQKPGGW